MKRFSKCILRVVLAGLVVFGPGLAFCAWYYQVYSWHDYRVYGAMSHECHPVWREFNFRRIEAGADLTEVIDSTKPAEITTFGDFAVLRYQDGLHFTGVGATAYKGRLVEAGTWSCCWSKIFFDVRAKQQKDQMELEYKAYMKPTFDRWAREAAEEKLKDAQNALRDENNQ